MLDKQIKIIGIGNVLCGEDALGTQVINRLQKLTLPENVTLVYGETDAWFGLEEAMDASYVIIVDAIWGNQGTNEVFKLKFSELYHERQELFVHDISLIDLIAFFNARGESIKGVIIGAECNSIEVGSSSVGTEDKINLIVKEILATLNNILK
jgi:hydrogenase maturation protease